MPVNFRCLQKKLTVLTPKETGYFFGDVPPSVETLKNYIFIYKRNP